MSDDDSLEDDFEEDEQSTGDETLEDDVDDVVAVSDSLAAMADKEAERLRLQADIEAFLARGGEIVEIPSSVISDPPKKPVSSYGGQPI